MQTMQAASKSPTNLSRHIPVLDGIRGLAILAVLLFHTTVFHATARIDYWYLKIGLAAWIGVDLFFVLSGFLITGILYDAKGTRYYFRNFYARRILRICPLYFLVLSVAIFILPYLSGRFPHLGGEQWWYWTYLSNFYIAEHGLGHLVLGPTWSLAIEEQFYVIWPVIVFLLPRKALLALCLLIISAAVGLRWSLLDAGAHPNVSYVSTYTRMDALAIGAWFAVFARGRAGIGALFPWVWILVLSAGAVLAYLLEAGLINKKHPEMIQFGYLISALFFGGALIIVLAQPTGGWVYRLLTNRVFLFFGKYSYAIYLFNRPFVDIIAGNWFRPNDLPTFLGSSLPGQIAYAIVVIAIPTVLAVISWHLFEKHFLRLKKYFQARPEINDSSAIVMNSGLHRSLLQASKPDHHAAAGE